MSATRSEAVTASEHLGMLNSSLEFVNQKLHNNLTRPCETYGMDIHGRMVIYCLLYASV